MKPNVLLAGGSGYIGKYISSVIEKDANIYALSKYPNTKKEDNDRIIWLKRDIYNYTDVVKGMEGMDIAVFYLDPNKNSAKLTQATARDLNLIAADNFARAAAQQGVSKIVYISGSRFDSETVQRLENYGVPVEKTNTQIKRPHINAELQMSKYDDIRTAMRMILPRKWTLSYLVDYFVHLYDYIPKLLWPIYYFVQAPLQGLIMRGFEIDCRIKHFNGRVQSGEKMKYTK
ncbi:NAD(P)H-binding protein [Staphylococcus haemolyticus]|uniref:NAD(P)H-binding protein n=1 Tax=Staphylococcus haemolyticus TaxID=1283 RepID=UPI001F0A7C18|nr:NAD(P)H-binding protein [Staphylococcus haemolyticus]MCH4336280.1 NAD(P)H-binding protein [Staphylococcus haemolyticus]